MRSSDWSSAVCSSDLEFLSGEGRNTEEVTNPATLDVLGQRPHASTADLDRALAAAALAFESWRHSSPMQRSEILRKVGQLSRERAQEIGRKIGRASCRERVCQYV